MNDARAVVGMDRLPWLTDEPKRRPPAPRAGGSLRELLGWAVAALLLVAGVAYWLGTRNVGEAPVDRLPESSATVPLPEARAVVPEDVRPALPPEVEATPAPAVTETTPSRPAAAAKRKKLSPAKVKKTALAMTVEKQSKAPPRRRAQVATRSQTLGLWPSRQTQGAHGRLVRIGAFGSRYQAKLGWRRMVRAYPAVGRLPAVVVESRNSRGRRFYRFQIGTTSQAHSEVLCQWMQRIRFSCAVIGLPWKPRGVER
jgi:hypothetical protein